MLAPPRGFSQLAASFVGYQHQGIPRVPFLPFPRSSPYFFPLSPILLSMCMSKLIRWRGERIHAPLILLLKSFRSSP